MITAPDTRAQMNSVAPAPVRRRLKKHGRIVDWALKGEEHPKAKLTDGDVLEMRELFKDRAFREEFKSDHKILTEFAKIYNIHYTTAYKIVNGHSWKHLIDA